MEAIRTPPLSSVHSDMFRQAGRVGDEALQRYVSVGSSIELAQNFLQNNAATPNELWKVYQTHIQPDITNYANSQAYATYLMGAGPNALDIRTRIFAQTIDEMVCIPLLMDQKFCGVESRKIRKELLQSGGLLGRLAEIIEEIIDEVDYRNKGKRTSALIGLTNEVTALALTSLPQNPDEVMIPSLPFADRRHKQDTIAYIGRYTPATVYPYQIKSFEFATPTPQDTHARLIGGIALGNSTRSIVWEGTSGELQTASALVDLTEGRLDPHSETILHSLSSDLVRAVRSGESYAADPTDPRFLPYAPGS